ncbi:MAG: hypothetical protein AAF282_18500 [Cyanobacteria bacterium P01_A01_bin.15]
MLRKTFLLFILVGTTALVSGQTFNDALRFSAIDPSGTARFMAVGGALGPLGADLSVTGTNPAGIAMFRRSEFTVTPSMFLSGADAQLTAVGTNTRDNRSTFNFHNLGVVMTSEPSARGWSTLNMAITLNNIGNFNRRFTYSGSTSGTIAQRWQELANTAGIDNFEAGLAFDAGAVYDIDDDPNDYEIDYEGAEGQLLEKGQTVTESGSITELSFAFAANYNERLMIGLSIGVPIITYEYESVYTETDEKSPLGGNVPFFESLEYSDGYTTTGGGINAKLGLIYRVNQTFRVGGAVHTPSAYTLEDEFETSLVNNYFADADESGDFIGGEAMSTGLFEYDYRTPWRFFGGAGVILGRNGFVTAEVELVNHGGSRFGYDQFPEDEEAVNADISDFLDNVVNLRLGGEFVYNQFRFRGGIGTFPSAFVGDDTRRTTLSAGVGYRAETYFFDVGYRYSTDENLFFPYDTQNAVLQEVSVDSGLSRFLLTFGAKF